MVYNCSMIFFKKDLLATEKAVSAVLLNELLFN